MSARIYPAAARRIVRGLIDSAREGSVATRRFDSEELADRIAGAVSCHRAAAPLNLKITSRPERDDNGIATGTWIVTVERSHKRWGS